MMKDLPSIKELLYTPKNVVITTHANPDADALGSSLGLYWYLTNSGHSAKVIVPTEYPDFLKWMPGNETVLAFTKENAEDLKGLFLTCDVIFSLDFSDLKRIDELGKFVADSKAKKVNIDHHQNPQDFSDLVIHSTEAAAAAELVYDLIVGMDGKAALEPKIADCLYAGIMTDTGSFKHSNTTAKVHRTVADLIEAGADTGRVSREIYDTNSLNRLRFLGFALSKLLQVDKKNGVGYFAISQEVAERFNLQSGDTEGLVNYALSIKGMSVAALFKEKDGKVKMSFRSVGDIAVNKFAEAHFSGGGHNNAAGGISDLSLNETVEKFKKLVDSKVLVG